MCGSRYRGFKSNRGKIPKGVWHLGGVALVRHTKMDISQSFLSFNFCVVVDLDVMDKLGQNSKSVVAPRERDTCEYKQKWV